LKLPNFYSSSHRRHKQDDALILSLSDFRRGLNRALAEADTLSRSPAMAMKLRPARNLWDCHQIELRQTARVDATYRHIAANMLFFGKNPFELY
jgi:hypothetical protein